MHIIREGKGREGKGREGKGREGKGREGKGREGKGREGKGREGKGSRIVYRNTEYVAVIIPQCFSIGMVKINYTYYTSVRSTLICLVVSWIWSNT